MESGNSQLILKVVYKQKSLPFLREAFIVIAINVEQ